MRKQRKSIIICTCIVCLLAAMLSGCSAQARAWSVWVDGKNLFRADGNAIDCGLGSASYDYESNTLTLSDAEITHSRRGAAVYVKGDIRIVLEGNCTVEGGKYAVCVEGDASVFARGSVSLSGKKVGIQTDGALSFERGTGLVVSGRRHALEAASVSVDESSALSGGESVETCRTLTAYDASPCLILTAPYKITYILNGGSGTLYDYAASGTQVRRPEDPMRTDYAFTDWYTGPELTEPYDFSAPVSGDIYLHAGWIELEYVWFDSWGGSPVDEQAVRKGDTASEPEPPVREGYRFLGWYADEGLETPFDFSQGVLSGTVVYARWEKLAEEVTLGIDVSEHQGEIDWGTVYRSGIDFALLRAGYRGYGPTGGLNPDLTFASNLADAQTVGMPVGVYFYSQAVTKAEAVEEANYVLTLLDGAPLTLPVVMDYEYASGADGNQTGRLYEAGLSPTEQAEICRAFAATVQASGYDAMVYASRTMLEEGLGAELDAAGVSVWLANWTVQTRYNGQYSIWQYSDCGSVPGITSAVDLDIWYN